MGIMMNSGYLSICTDTVCACSVCLQCAPAVCSILRLQRVPAECTGNVRLQCAPAVCACNVCLQCAPETVRHAVLEELEPRSSNLPVMSQEFIGMHFRHAPLEKL